MSIALNLANPGDIPDYATLLNRLRSWLDRGSDLDGLLATFVTLAESYLNRTLRTPDMEATAPVAIVNGSVALPADFLAMRGLTANGYPLNAMSPAQLATTYGALTGFPQAFAISGGNLTVAPMPAIPPLQALPTFSLAYWQRIPGLSTNNPENWLLSSNPDIYLFGALAFASDYITDPDATQKYTALFQAAVDSLVTSGNKQRWGGPIVARSGVRQVCGVRA